MVTQSEQAARRAYPRPSRLNATQLHGPASTVAPTPAHVASRGGIQDVAGSVAARFVTTFTGVMPSITKGSFVAPLAVAGVPYVVGALS